MTSEVAALSATAAFIGLTHTLLGPDHYLPFIVMSRAWCWSSVKTAVITVLCGLGHVAGSVAIGATGIFLGRHHINDAYGRDGFLFRNFKTACSRT